jgi:hypothetical protein
MVITTILSISNHDKFKTSKQKSIDPSSHSICSYCPDYMGPIYGNSRSKPNNEQFNLHAAIKSSVTRDCYERRLLNFLSYMEMTPEDSFR